jgi:ABC-type oligopeptide transport system substrate-binding subunit
MGRALADQAVDFQLGKADVVEDQVTSLRRLKQAGTSVFLTNLAETLALQFDETRVPENVREAVALAIDRPTIHDVILQRQGEVSAALLPRSLSGYSFLFTSVRDVARARQIAPSAAPLAFTYDAQDPVARPVGQRIEVNVREAGITLRPSSGAADVRLVRLPVTSRDPWIALQDMAALTKAPPAAGASAYETERALLEKFRVIPLVQLPKVWVLSSRVRDWPRLADVWIDPARKP